jgi:hypothetical protein
MNVPSSVSGAPLFVLHANVRVCVPPFGAH